jgi:probable blue pigment (indigoidine) exporter
MKTYRHGSRAVIGLTLLAPISWGTTYVTVTELLPQGRPLFVASMRVVPAGIALVAIGFISSRWRPRGQQWRQTATLALFNFGIFVPLLIVAVYRLPGGVAAAVGGVQPLFVLLITRLLIGTKPRRFDIAIGTIAVVGVALVVVRPGAAIDPIGVVVAVAANVSFAIGVVLTKRFPAPDNRLAATGWQLLMSSVVIVPLAVLIEGSPPELTARNLGGFAYLSLAGTGLAAAIWFNGISRLPATAPPLLGLAAPITGATLGWVILSQSLSQIQLLGSAITIATIVYGTTVSASGPRAEANPSMVTPASVVLQSTTAAGVPQ